MGGLRSFVKKSSVSASPTVTVAESGSVSDLHCELYTNTVPSVIRIVELLVRDAHSANASDIHLDPRPTETIVRYRIDGLLEDTHVIPQIIHTECISRIKVLAGLRIDEHHAAQDGRFHVTVENVLVDIRVSVVPTFYGENAVLRILSGQRDLQTLDSLGFTARNRDLIMRGIKKSHGLVLCTGPTGSGKTTTLYSLVSILNRPEIAIITIEDPIEYSIPAINQIQINPRTGLTFENGLRSVLRQDPNIIMVGEIRDTETAGLAAHAALTGHLLLSTLHTNDAPTAVPRLLDMGIEPYLVASTVSLVVGQRLVRRVCEACKCDVSAVDLTMFPESVVAEFKNAKTTFCRGAGCASCKGTGYRGRVGIHEVLVMNEELREAVVARASAGTIRQIALDAGMVPLRLDGLRKAAHGVTTVEEILRVQYE